VLKYDKSFTSLKFDVISGYKWHTACAKLLEKVFRSAFADTAANYWPILATVLTSHTCYSYSGP